MIVLCSFQVPLLIFLIDLVMVTYQDTSTRVICPFGILYYLRRIVVYCSLSLYSETEVSTDFTLPFYCM